MTVISYGSDSQDVKYTIDLDKMKVIDEVSENKGEDLFVQYSQIPEKFYKVGNTTYELRRNLFLYDDLSI